MADPLFTDRALQEAYRMLMRDHAGAGHLTEAAWDRLVSGDAGDAERAELFDHVLACERCSTIWRGVLALQQDAAAQGLVAPAVQPRASWRSPAVALAIAATLILAVGSVFIIRRPAPVADTVRSGDQLATIDGLMMAYDRDYVPTFVWPPVISATQYRVEVFSADGKPVWSRTQAAPPLPWPADVTAAKGAYRWRVEALKGDTVIARSRLTAMELTK